MPRPLHTAAQISRLPSSDPALTEWAIDLGEGRTGRVRVPVSIHDAVEATDKDAYLQEALADLQKEPATSYIVAHDKRTGEQKWKHEYDCSYDVSYPNGPRCTPNYEAGKLYTLGAQGNLFCLLLFLTNVQIRSGKFPSKGLVRHRQLNAQYALSSRGLPYW